MLLNCVSLECRIRHSFRTHFYYRPPPTFVLYAYSRDLGVGTMTVAYVETTTAPVTESVREGPPLFESACIDDPTR